MFRLALLCVLVVASSAPLFAQSPTGTIAGTVADQVGALLPNATVTVTNADTGAKRVVQTAPDGSFSLPSLPAGTYDVVVTITGFQPVVSPVTVTTGATTTLKFALDVGTREETVTVTGAAAS